ncbi:MAG: DUF4270 domain-containing protein [Tannerellaceae bacterium]
MKNKLLLLSSLFLIFIGCNDDLSDVGTSMQPDKDKITSFADTFDMKSKTIQVDSIYAKTIDGLLGNLNDPVYGQLKADYVCQFYIPDEYKFPEKVVNGKIDSIDLKVFYRSWIGDSLSPMQATAYLVTSQLTKDYYTNIDPKEFCDMSTLLGEASYTSYDRTVPDSVRNNTNFVPHFTMKFPRELGQKLYDESLKNPSIFETPEKFAEYFPGIYVSNTFGDGNILKVELTHMNVYYNYEKTVKGSEGQDSTYIADGVTIFNVTPEIIQLNHVVNSDLSELLTPNDEYTFLKTPAGVYTEMELPLQEMYKTLEGRIINEASLKIKVTNKEDYRYALDPPSYLLLIEQDSIKTFFEDQKLPDNKSSYLAALSKNELSYNFGNIATLLQEKIKEEPEANLNYVLVPVSASISQTLGTILSVKHYFYPSGVKIRKDKDYMQLKVISSKFNRNQ